MCSSLVTRAQIFAPKTIEDFLEDFCDRLIDILFADCELVALLEDDSGMEVCKG